jgi:hypothetical protein
MTENRARKLEFSRSETFCAFCSCTYPPFERGVTIPCLLFSLKLVMMGIFFTMQDTLPPVMRNWGFSSHRRVTFKRLFLPLTSCDLLKSRVTWRNASQLTLSCTAHVIKSKRLGNMYPER